MKNEQSIVGFAHDGRPVCMVSGIYVRSGGPNGPHADVLSGSCPGPSSVLSSGSGISPNTRNGPSSLSPVLCDHLEIKMSDHIQKQKMENVNNFYEHLEWLKDIYLHRLQEINVMSNEKNELNSKVKELTSKVNDAESRCRKLMCEAKTAVEVLEKEIEFLKSADEEAARTVENYYKIPRWIRRVFVSE
jgi:hypothetical protein